MQVKMARASQIKKAIIKKTINSKSEQGCEERESFEHQKTKNRNAM
jgi:hypothetical protein